MTNVMLESGTLPVYTPWKIDMEHKNGGLEDDFPFQLADFYGPC